VTTITPVRNENPGTVPPWLADPVLPLPDPIGDTPTVTPPADAARRATLEGWAGVRRDG